MLLLCLISIAIIVSISEAMVFTPVTQYWKRLSKTIHKSGSWFTSGSWVMPPLYVDKKLTQFPITADMCKTLIQSAEMAPFGAGSVTKLDDTVRKGWQINADRVTFGRSGNKLLKALTEELQEKMVIPDIQLKLYKLLIYEAGGHFKPHRDTLRSPQHIGSVIVSLPIEDGAECKGGKLKVHGPGPLSDTVKEWDGKTEVVQSCYSAFFTDCVHELKPVKSGYRVALAFEMHYAAKRRRPTVPALVPSQEWFEQLKRFVDAALTDGRDTIVFPTTHQYGEIGNNPAEQLKGADLVLYHALQTDVGESCNITVKEIDVYHEDYPLGHGDTREYIDGQSTHLYYTDPYLINETTGEILDYVEYSKYKRKKEEFRDEVPSNKYYDGLDLPRIGTDDDEDEGCIDFDPEKWYAYDYNRKGMYLCDATTMECIQDVTGAEFTGNEPAPYKYRYRSVCITVKKK